MKCWNLADWREAHLTWAHGTTRVFTSTHYTMKALAEMLELNWPEGWSGYSGLRHNNERCPEMKRVPRQSVGTQIHAKMKVVVQRDVGSG